MSVTCICRMMTWLVLLPVLLSSCANPLKPVGQTISTVGQFIEGIKIPFERDLQFEKKYREKTILSPWASPSVDQLKKLGNDCVEINRDTLQITSFAFPDRYRVSILRVESQLEQQFNWFLSLTDSSFARCDSNCVVILAAKPLTSQPDEVWTFDVLVAACNAVAMQTEPDSQNDTCVSIASAYKVLRKNGMPSHSAAVLAITYATQLPSFSESDRKRLIDMIIDAESKAPTAKGNRSAD